MAMIFFALLVVTLSFNFFMISYQVNGINRLVYGVPVSLFETSLNLYGVDENNGAFFIKDTLEEKTTIELFDEFYERVNGQHMTEEQFDIMKDIIKEVEEA